MGWVKTGVVVSIIVIDWTFGSPSLTYTELWMLTMLTSLYVDRMAERADGRYKDAA